jgi:hypothetical protein
MFYTLHIPEDVDAISLVQACTDSVAIGSSGIFGIASAGPEEEDVCAGVVCYEIKMAEYA